MKAGMFLLLHLDKQVHDKEGIAESLHVHTNRLIACELGTFREKNHNSQK